MPNHLTHETSPYLKQHATNPVDWYPWNQEALAAARAADKPIFLSIGYSSCHWCHVMERESFVDPETAAFLNAHFVSIKVDREERPDLDAVYMQAVTSLTGHGGWPLSVWLTPEGVPFYGGTYFPPTPRYGMPSFRQVLASIAELWTSRRDQVEEAAEELRRHFTRPEAQRKGGLPRGRLLEQATAELERSADPVKGGWGTAPKFPQPLVIEYLLAQHYTKPLPELHNVIRTTLDAMAAGGIYDHLGGGFHRYSVDGSWLVPHFEKMLYDNAQLARCYLHAWQATGAPCYRRVAEETLDYLLRDMRDPAGGFYSAEDADSEGREGAFYTWTPTQLREALTPEEAEIAEQTYGVSAEGHLEGASVLHLNDRGAGEPAGSGTGAANVAPANVARIKAKLLEARGRRLRPARDDKILAAWNGLTLAALAEAGAALGTTRYLEAALKTGGFIRDNLIETSGLLAHSITAGRVSGEGFLDDYACVAEGFLALYQATFAEPWFVLAQRLCDTLAERFSDPGDGFYDTGPGHEALITRPRGLHDSPTAAGNSMAATVLLKMAAFTGEGRYWSLADEALDAMAATAAAAPTMAGQWLVAALMAETGLTEVALVGDLRSGQGRELLRVVTGRFRPLAVVAARPAGRPSVVPLLEAREPGPGHSAAWVCRGTTCTAPTADPVELARLLERFGI
jgi:hypothetical protein